MTTATRKDILSVFPDLEDHTLVEILDIKPTVDDLEAASVALSSEDDETIGIRQREGDRINSVLNILNRAGIEAPLGDEL